MTLWGCPGPSPTGIGWLLPELTYPASETDASQDGSASLSDLSLEEDCKSLLPGPRRPVPIRLLHNGQLAWSHDEGVRPGYFPHLRCAARETEDKPHKVHVLLREATAAAMAILLYPSCI